MKIREVVLIICLATTILWVMRSRVKFDAYKLTQLEERDSLLKRISQDSILLSDRDKTDSINRVNKINKSNFKQRYDSLKKVYNYDPEKYRENGQ